MKNLRGLVFGEELEFKDLNQKMYFTWLSKQKNCLLFNERFVVKLSYLFNYLSFKANIYISKFYLIINSGNISKILSLSFSDSKIEHQLETLLSLYKYCEDKYSQVCSYQDQIFLYFPCEIGNVFSQKRFLYEINAYYLYSLKSYRSIDGNRSISGLKHWRIEEDQAILNEYYDNSASNFHEDIAYLDFIGLYKCSGVLITEYFECIINFLEADEFNQIFDVLNQLYFEIVIQQQINLVNEITTKHAIPENIAIGDNKKSISKIFHQLICTLAEQKNKMDKHSYQKLYCCLKKWKYKTSHSKIHARDHNINKKIIGLKSDDCEKFVWENILRYFLYDNYTGYVNTTFARLETIFHEKQTNQIKDILKIISIDIYGQKSPLYSKTDNRKVFFKDVLASFEPYFSKGFGSKHLKYFLDEKMESRINRILSELNRKN